MLKMAGVTLEKISDSNKYMFFEQGMRVGVSYINKRYTEASKNVNILYLDMNNSYGCAMRQYFPINNFKGVKKIDKIEHKLMNIKINSSTVYVLEVDLEYPQELHDIHNVLEVDLEYPQELRDIHNDYPLAPEKINIPEEWLPKYCLKIGVSIILPQEQLKN